MAIEERLRDACCVVTGGTGGIGLITARRLAEMGARVFIVGRDRNRGLEAQTSIRLATGHDGAEFLQADLSDQNDVRLVAEAISNRCDRIDVLVNNVGGMFRRRQLSAQGLEMTFALNHLSHFLLTALLLPKLTAAPRGARVVNVASEAHRRVALDFDDLQAEKSYSGWLAYRGQSWRTCCLRRSWRGGWTREQSPSLPYIPDLLRPTSVSVTVSCRGSFGGSQSSRRSAPSRVLRPRFTSHRRRKPEGPWGFISSNAGL